MMRRCTDCHNDGAHEEKRIGVFVVFSAQTCATHCASFDAVASAYLPLRLLKLLALVPTRDPTHACVDERESTPSDRRCA